MRRTSGHRKRRLRFGNGAREGGAEMVAGPPLAARTSDLGPRVAGEFRFGIHLASRSMESTVSDSVGMLACFGQLCI